jgi:anti-sigma B factor antagonist
VDLKFSTRERPGVTIVDFKGRITIGEESVLLRETIRKLLAEKRVFLLLNLAEVTRVDSAGIGTLVEGAILSAQAGGRLKLLKIPRLLHNSLVIHRLLQAFEVFTDEEAALKSFPPSAASA